MTTTGYDAQLQALGNGKSLASVVITTATEEHFEVARRAATAVCQAAGIDQFAVVFTALPNRKSKTPFVIEVAESEES